MSSFTVILNKNTANDLEEIYSYISESLKEPSTAEAYLKMIRKAIKSLDEMPMRNMLIDEEPFHMMGLRRMLVKNFYIYYSVDIDNAIVTVHGVIYARRDQITAIDK